ncbi:MAG: DUF6328 family protein [Luteolibacter sp.]
MNEDSLPDEEILPLSKAVLLLLEECRMVLPGIQALFGFQLIAVFNSRFAEALSRTEQSLHLLRADDYPPFGGANAYRVARLGVSR